MMNNRNRALSGGAAALIAAGALSLSAIAPATAAPTDAPVLAGDAGTTTGSASITIDVLANDLAPEGAEIDAATLALVDETGAPVPAIEGELGTWRVADGQLAFAPAEGASGVAEATYTVATSAGLTATATVTVTIEQPAPVEPAPIEPAPEATVEAEDDKVAHVFSAESPVATVDVLANDEVEGGARLDPSTLALVGEDGELVQELETEEGIWSTADGQVAFAAAGGFVGHAVAEYSVATDTGETATGEVRVDATWAGVEPDIALEDDTLELPRHEDATVDVLSNDVVEGVTLDSETLQLIGEDGQPADEVTTRAGTWSVVDGEVVFDGHPRHKGEASISYVVQTADGTAGATLTVDVDQRPAAALR